MTHDQNIMNRVSIILTGNIFIKNGGLTKAIFARANAFAEESVKVILATFQYHQNFNELVNYHKENNNLHQNVEVINIYDYNFGENYNKLDILKRPFEILEKDIRDKTDSLIRYPDKRNANGYRCFKQGKYCSYELYENNILKTIDVFQEPWTRTKKIFLDTAGRINRENLMDTSTNKPKVICYYNDGLPTITSNVDSKGNENNFFIHTANQEINGKENLLKFWLQSIIDNFEKVTVFCDKRDLVGIFTSLKHTDIKRIFVQHSTHLDFPYDDPKIIEPTMKNFIDNSHLFSKIIVLTQEQKRDLSFIESIDNNKVMVIPHYQNKIDFRGNRKKYTAVSIARYHSAKNLEDAIKVFSEVVKIIPKAKYEIYGYGPDENKLKEFIEKLNLKNNVFLKGFTTNPIEKFGEATLSIMTSRYEGFGMVITESLACGTPVVSYNTKYGPSEIIRDGIDGFVVQKGNIIKMAECIIEIMNNDEKFNMMSENAQEVSKRFSRDTSFKLWKEQI